MTFPDLVLGEETIALLAGSYEELPRRVHRAISEDRQRLFGGKQDFQLLGTFADHALVLLPESRDIVKVQYELNKKNEIVPTVASIAQQVAYTTEEATKKTARAFVEAFINGSRGAASDLFKKLSNLTEDADLPQRAAHYVETFEARVQSAEWRKTFETKKTEITKSVKESFTPSEWAPKFKKLHDGSTPSSELSQYSGLVTSDVKYMQERFEELLRQTEKAREGIKQISAEDEAEMPITRLESFTDSLFSDINGVNTRLTEMRESGKPIDVQSKIYDFLASELNRYEVAVTFVNKMSCDLMKVAEEA